MAIAELFDRLVSAANTYCASPRTSALPQLESAYNNTINKLDWKPGPDSWVEPRPLSADKLNEILSTAQGLHTNFLKDPAPKEIVSNSRDLLAVYGYRAAREAPGIQGKILSWLYMIHQPVIMYYASLYIKIWPKDTTDPMNRWLYLGVIQSIIPVPSNGAWQTWIPSSNPFSGPLPDHPDSELFTHELGHQLLLALEEGLTRALGADLEKS